jgi:hypothetical protein
MGAGKKLLVEAFKWRRRAYVIRRRGILPFLAFQGVFRALPKGAKKPVVEGLRRKYYLARHMGIWFPVCVPRTSRVVGALVFALMEMCGV